MTDLADLHIDDFFRDAAIVLNRLYLAFPRKCTLFVEDVIGSEETDEFGMHSARFDACFAAMLWLADEGYLRYESTVRQEAVDQAVLSGQMFTMLSVDTRVDGQDVSVQLPESVRLLSATNIHRLRAALVSQSSTAIRKLMTELFRQLQAQRARG